MGDEITKQATTEKAEEFTPVEAVADGIGEKKPPEALPEAAEEEVSDSIVGEFLLFLKEEKKWWLAPLVIVLVALGSIILFAEGSAIAPFIYTIF